MIYFDQILQTFTFLHRLDAGMQTVDEASPSINPTGRGHLMKLLITLEPLLITLEPLLITLEPLLITLELLVYFSQHFVIYIFAP